MMFKNKDVSLFTSEVDSYFQLSHQHTCMSIKSDYEFIFSYSLM